MQFPQKNLHFNYLCTTRDLDHSRLLVWLWGPNNHSIFTVVTIVHTQAWPHTLTFVHTCAHPHPPAHIPAHEIILKRLKE